MNNLNLGKIEVCTGCRHKFGGLPEELIREFGVRLAAIETETGTAARCLLLKSGCLGNCFHGPSILITPAGSPEGYIVGNGSLADVPRLISEALGEISP